MTLVLVTGAAGFLGTNITLNLLDQGYKVKAFELEGANIKYIDRKDVEIVYGDVTNLDSIKKALENVDIVIHVAGDTSFWKKLFDRQRKINVDGVRNVMQAVYESKAKIQKVIHTATVDVLGYNPEGLADERWDDNPDNYNYANTGYNYADTKREGEKIVKEYAEKGLNVSIINPGSMMGLYDHTLQFGRLFIDIRDGNIPGILPGGAPWAHVNEVAKAHITAIDKGKQGERYICGGFHETYKTQFNLIAESINVKPPKLVMPAWATISYGYICEFISKFSNNPPDLNPGQARYMTKFPKYDSSKAEKELGFKMVPLKKMVEDARDWYIENEFL
ncbi:MAG: NAD-dependent epimerase/dehydratase family protein [archaeon]|nr:NAD-dependent epimerase/dehydratase family protein [archaeon]